MTERQTRWHCGSAARRKPAATPGAGTEGWISRCCSSPRGGGGWLCVGLCEHILYVFACVWGVTGWRWYMSVYELAHVQLRVRVHASVCISDWVHAVLCVCLSVYVCMCKCVFQQPQSAWGRGTYKRHLARRAKTTKVTLPPVMYSVFCSGGKCNMLCVNVCVRCHGGCVHVSTFLCLCVSATFKVVHIKMKALVIPRKSRV